MAAHRFRPLAPGVDICGICTKKESPAHDVPDYDHVPTPFGTTRDLIGRATRPIRGCGCECSRGGFCGGCGHAGCGGR